MTEKKIRVGQYTVAITHPDKVFFPDDGITKEDLADYYRRIARVMLPYSAGRPISMQRFPNGIDNEGFYQKEIPDYFPEWIHRARVDLKEGGSQQQVVIENAATLVYLADQGCITPHVWLSRADNLDYPDRMVFDFDPAGDEFEPIRAAAHLLRGILEELGLVPFVMTTGSRGLHVVTAIDRSADFDTVRTFARDVAELLARREPDALTTEPRKEQRRGRLFLDYLRNAYAQTAVVPYAVRARRGAPVATPLEWSELHDRSLGPQTYNIGNIFRRLAAKDDPWAGIQRRARSLSAPQKRLDALISNEKS
jgi:bifunctional non-homologous end joining protein LigD